MNGAQTIVALGGVGLVAANYWTMQRRPVVSILQNVPGASVSSAHSVFVEIGGELLFVTVATILAGTSPGLGELLVVVFVGLAILFGISYSASSSGTTSTPGSTSNIGSTGKVAGSTAKAAA